jgi:N-methylhydantoinase A
MRFVGQAFEVPVEVSESDIDGLGEERLIGLFDDAHHRMFFHGITPGKRVEIVAFRLGISKPLDAIPALREDRSGAATAAQGTVFDNRVQLTCQMLPASALRLNQAIEGPTLIESFTATTYIPVGWRATLDQQDNIIVRRVAT